MNDTVAETLQNPKHHAYIFFGHTPKRHMVPAGDQCYFFSFEKNMSIGIVREIQEYAIHATGSRKRKIILIAPGIHAQAQNALLKTIEDLQDGVFFFFFLPVGAEVLETLLSRVVVFEGVGDRDSHYSEEFKQFMTATTARRMEMLNTIWDSGEGHRHASIAEFARNFEIYVHRQIQNHDAVDQALLESSMVILDNFKDAIRTGALNKSTLQLFAFAGR